MAYDIQAATNFKRISLLYQSAPIAVNGLIVGFFTLFFALKDLLPSSYLIAWSSSFCIALVWRVGLIIGFKHRLKHNHLNTKNIQRWEYYWVLMTAFSAFVFAVLIFFPFSHDNLIALLFISMVFMGMSSGSAISSNASVLVVSTFLTLTTLPLVFKAFYVAQPYYYLIAIVYSFFYLVLLKLTVHGNRILTENIRLKKQHEQNSLRDILTGLWNRRRLSLFTEQLMTQVERNGQEFAIILLDIDFFKKFNDTYGHLQGDKLLVSIAQCFQKIAREQDLVVRFGGEEFLIVLPNTNLLQAQQFAARVVSVVQKEIEVTVSAGIAIYIPQTSFESIVRHADDALYLAKERGRNQFVTAVQ
jgi:diguanylate cyclase (GGDEF)-like protein